MRQRGERGLTMAIGGGLLESHDMGRQHDWYPQSLATALGDAAPARLTTLGSPALLQGPVLALFCSVKCPGSLILQTYDLACALRDAGVTVIGGFHSPMERECLRLLLRGKQPVIVCPARSIWRRIPSELIGHLESGRLLILSPFQQKQQRMTAELASRRNEVVAAIAQTIFISYASPGGKTESFAQRVLGWGKTVLTFDSPDNSRLKAIGVRPVTVPEAVDYCQKMTTPTNERIIED